MKTFEILWALPKCDAEIQSEPMPLGGKNNANRLAQHRVATKFQFVKHRLYLWSTTKQSKIKWGMPACDKDTDTHRYLSPMKESPEQVSRSTEQSLLKNFNI